MDLQGKTLYFLGDSITQGACATKEEYVYHQVAAKILGAKTVVDGIGGTRLAKQVVPSEVPVYDQYFIPRARRADESADFAVVFGGVNDFAHGDAPFGEIGDRTEDTFCGCVYTLHSLLKEKFGDRVAVILPMHNSFEDDPYGEFSKKPVKGNILWEYRLAIKRTAEIFGFPVLDLWEDEQLNPNAKENAKYFADGLHPTDAGHAILGSRVADFLAKL